MTALVEPPATIGGLRRARGGHHPGDRWLGPLTSCDRRVLDRAEGPVLDIGCGPARHALALAQRGVPTLGIDITPALVALARPRGALVLERDVFARVPAEGRWRTVLLLDGNIGIGGSPAALLRRVCQLLRPGGLVLVELDPIGGTASRDLVRVEVDGSTGPWFAWKHVTHATLDQAVARTGLAWHERWTDDGRAFGLLARSPT